MCFLRLAVFSRDTPSSSAALWSLWFSAIHAPTLRKWINCETLVWLVFVLFSSRAVASSSCTELHGNGRRRLLEMREGTTVPRVLLTADPKHFSSLSHPFVSAYRRFAYTHTYNLIHTHPRSLAELCIRGAHSPVIFSLINLNACIDCLLHIGQDSFFHNTDMQIQILNSVVGRSWEGEREGEMRGRASSDV